VPEKLGGLRPKATTGGARAARDRPPATTHLPGITVFLDERRRREFAGQAHGSWRSPMPRPMVACRVHPIRRIPETDGTPGGGLARGVWRRPRLSRKRAILYGGVTLVLSMRRALSSTFAPNGLMRCCLLRWQNESLFPTFCVFGRLC